MTPAAPDEERGTTREVIAEVLEKHFGPSAIVTPANLLTLARIVLSPVVFLQILTGEVAGWGTAAFAFVLGISDGFDGWLARKYGTTRSGAFLDPLADKVLVLGAMFCLLAEGRFWWLPVVLVAVREAVISAFRFYWGRRGLAVQARPLAKAKTVVQSFACLMPLLPPLADGPRWPELTLLWAGVTLGLVSGAQYVIDGSRTTTTMERGIRVKGNADAM